MTRPGDSKMPSLYRSTLDRGGSDEEALRAEGSLESPTVSEELPSKMLLFRVAYMRLVVSLDSIRMVHRSERLLPLPEAPRHVMGLFQLGEDESIPVVDLARSLGIRSADEAPGVEPSAARRDEREHVLVYNSAKGVVGFLIDRAEAVVDAFVRELPESLQRHDSSIVGLAKLVSPGAGDEEASAYVIDLERHVP